MRELEQDRAGQGRAGQGREGKKQPWDHSLSLRWRRAGQGTAGQGRARQGRAGPGRSGVQWSGCRCARALGPGAPRLSTTGGSGGVSLYMSHEPLVLWASRASNPVRPIVPWMFQRPVVCGAC